MQGIGFVVARTTCQNVKKWCDFVLDNTGCELPALWHYFCLCMMIHWAFSNGVKKKKNHTEFAGC